MAEGKHVLILGGGNGGFALAVDLCLQGKSVMLWTRSRKTLGVLEDDPKIFYSGVLGEGGVTLAAAGTDLEELVPAAEAIVVALPATAHREVAEALAPHLSDPVPILLNPGGAFGALAFAQALRAAGHTGPLAIAETATLTHIARKLGPRAVRITSRLRELPAAAFPGRAGEELVRRFDFLPMLRPVEHILVTAFANVNAVLHPPGMVLAAGWIEATGGDFYFYRDLAVPSVARLLARLDEERLAVAARYGIVLPSFVAYFAALGSTSPEAAEANDYLRALRDSHPNHGLRAPPDLAHRYITEDIPLGLVPWRDLARLAGVSTPVMAAIITLLSAATGRDLEAEGRTLDRLGLAGKTVAELLQFLREGTL